MNNDFSSQDREILKILKNLESHKSEYPTELLAARRDTFSKQVSKHGAVRAQQPELPMLFDQIQSSEGEYPAHLFAARRAAFLRQVERLVRGSVLDVWMLAVKTSLAFLTDSSRTLNALRTSLLIASVAIMAFAAFLLYGNADQLASPTGIQDGFSAILTRPTGMTPTPTVICKQGYEPPQCLVQKFDKGQDLTDPQNGIARPAVAKDTFRHHGEIHRSAYLNDGLYGPGASWVSDSPDSWVKIDLGTSRVINTITFGKDRLGTLTDGDPGRFIIAIAGVDNVYADGNSNNDEVEYVQVYDSQQAGFDGVISGPETVMAQFSSRQARFIKITFENAGTAVDEVQVFMMPPLSLNEYATRKPNEEQPSNTAAPAPLDTIVPTATILPTETPLPTATSTPTPTETELPTETPLLPSATPLPPTDIPYIMPTEVVLPNDTPIPFPDNEVSPY